MEPGSSVEVIKSQRVFLSNEIRPALIIIKDGKISEIVTASDRETTTSSEVLDVGERLVMPGIVDSHVHVNEPGRTDWEGYWTATRSAASGGVTTIVDMPLNSIPPTTTLQNFRTKLEAASGKCFVDTAFWGGVIPGNQVIRLYIHANYMFYIAMMSLFEVIVIFIVYMLSFLFILNLCYLL
ncbi:ALN protein, partial [Polyodon spathula]|nr:ALN protein [Polyodon spathula]